MKDNFNMVNILNWVFGIIIVVVGILNLILVHPVPGIAYLMISMIFFPPTNMFLKENVGFWIPLSIKIILGVLLIIFTLGVSDLGDMIDKM